MTGHPIAVPLQEPAAAGPGTPPFLTVLVRTLGTRPEELAATLRSLAGQECTDFEVLLLHHTQHPDATRDVGWHPGPALPRNLVHRIRIVTVVGGARGRPLNTGIALSTGSYVAVLDDDDVAFADWVATFRDLAGRHPGAVLRSRVRSDTRQDDGSWRHENAYGPESFDLIDHLQVNSSPICGLAFPLRVVLQGAVHHIDTTGKGDGRKRREVHALADTLRGVANQLRPPADPAAPG